MRVHERTPSVRAEGYGIAIHENGLRVLEALGVREAVQAQGLRVTRLVTRDGAGRIVASVPVPGRTHRWSRQAIVEALAMRVARLGGMLETDSTVEAVTPDGFVTRVIGGAACSALDSARAELPRADLVVIANGIGSGLAAPLGLVERRRTLADGAMRLVVPRLEQEVDPGGPEGAAVVEQWSGTRRVIYSPCSTNEAYLALTCLARDPDGQRVPLHRLSWQDAFPALEALFDCIDGHADWTQVRWQRFQVLQLSAWSQGCVAVVGDAAHAMPPNLGQGAGCSLMNALGLAVALETEPHDVAAALASWEQRERPLTEHVQRWSARYGGATVWPAPLRGAFFALLGQSSWVRHQVQRAQLHRPTGT